MQKRHLLTISRLMSVMLFAFEVKNAMFELELDPTGATLKRLSVQGKTWCTGHEKQPSFDDQLGQNQDENLQRIEYTKRLEFALREMTISAASTKVAFSLRSLAFPGIRLEKTYLFSAQKPEFTLRWELTNTAESPIALSLNTRALLFRENMSNRYLHPQGADSFKEFQADEKYIFSQVPERAFLAVRNDQNDGAVILLPPEETAGVLNWSLNGPFGGYTQEFFATEKTLQPGESRAIEIKVVFTSDVAGCVASVAPRKASLEGVLPVQVERLSRIKPKAAILGVKGNPRAPENFIDVTFNRQFNDSWRSVRLPDDIRELPLAVYQIENGTHSVDRTVEFSRQGEYLMLKVPGLYPYGGMGLNNGRAWNVIENGYLVQKSQPFMVYGKVAFPCRIAVNDANGKEAKQEKLPAVGALFTNSGFERANPQKSFQPEGCSFVGRKAIDTVWLEAVPGTEGRALKVDTAFWDFILEPEMEHFISFRVKSDYGGKNSRIGLTFFSADGQPLNELRKTLFVSDRPLTWKQFEHKIRMPDVAAMVRLSVQGGKAEKQEFILDDLIIGSTPLSTVQRSIRELAREELAETWNLPLSLIEPISMENVSPHETWFKPAAQPSSEILFLTNLDSKISAGIGRRKIVELVQRNDLKFRHIPLIRRILSMPHGFDGAFSVQGTTFDKCLSDYTIACLKELPARPAVVCVMEFDFNNAGEEFLKILHEWQEQGTNFYFFICSNTPESLLGKRVKNSLFPLIPRMRATGTAEGFRIQWHQNGNSKVAVRASNFLDSTAYIPKECDVKRFTPILYGRDFPWFEFDHQIDMAVLRHLDGITPAASLESADLNGVVVKGKAPFKGTLKLTFDTLHRDRIRTQALPVALEADKATIPLPLEGLPSGELLVYISLLSQEGKVVDAGAVKVTLPGASPEVLFDVPERIFRWPAPVSFKVAGIPADQDFEVEIENNHGEVVFREKRQAGADASFKVALPGLLTLLNYVRVKTFRQGNFAAIGWGEFSTPGLPLDLKEYHGFINAGPVAIEAVHDLGFEFAITGNPSKKTPLIYRQYRSANIFPIPRRGDDQAWFRKYRSDVKTEPVRTPCFSSPEFRKLLHDDTEAFVKSGNLVYYDVSNLWSGDEMFLGQSVCTSPTCLAEFRHELQDKYGSIAALNQEWETHFASFDEVVPKQRDALVSQDNLAPWVDHKLFMTKVFAKHFFGAMRDELAAQIPNAKIGPTGTQRPGYGYNWWELMKYCRIVGYYAGVQTTMVNDFGNGQLLAGQCGGGYTHGHIDYEPYNYNTMWYTLLNGGNLAYHYYGCAINAEWKITDNMKYFSRSMKEIKRGIGKLWLEAHCEPEVAVFYSMPSLFTAIGTIGEQPWQDTQTSWMKLLGDLKVESRFLAGEEIVEKGIPPQYKVLILPMALALSDAEIKAFVDFAERGGIILTDTAPGRFDEHGKRRNSEALNKLFAPCTIPLKSTPITLPDNKGEFETAENGLPLRQFQACGKGGALNVNLLICRYSVTQLGGVGGEIATITEGEAQFQQTWQSIIGEYLANAGVKPFAQIRKADGSLYGCHARFRQDGPNRLYAFHQPVDRYSRGRFDFSKADVVQVQIPAKGHVYEIRSGKYLGHTDTFEMRILGGWSMMYAVLPQKVGAVSLTGPKETDSGASAKFTFAVENTEGAQTFHFALYGPDGKEIERHAKNIRTLANQGDYALLVPFNAPKGTYRAEITHVASSQKSTMAFTVK